MNADLNIQSSSKGGSAPPATEWIDRYVNEVGRRLPPRQRADVEREIRSLIEDEVAGRLDAAAGDSAPQPSAEATVLAVLEQFGAPEEMAARYQAPRYLISPAIFPVYQIVLGIVLAVTVFASLFGLAVAAGTGGVRPIDETMTAVFGNVLQAFGSVTLIFVALERLGVSASRKRATAWNPRGLPPVKDEQRISIFETAVEIGFLAALLGLTINYLYSGAGPVYYNGEWQPLPIFSQELLQYIPWLAVIWGADILVNIVLLARRALGTSHAHCGDGAGGGERVHLLPDVDRPNADGLAPTGSGLQDHGGDHLCREPVGGWQAGMDAAAQQCMGRRCTALAAWGLEVVRAARTWRVGCTTMADALPDDARPRN